MTRFLPGRSLHHSLDLEKNYYSKYIGDLEKKIEEKSFNNDIDLGLFFTERPKKINKEYGEELKRQIELKTTQKALENLEKQKPHINLDFHGYPNIPQTPREERRRREKLKMSQVRQDLIAQQELKKQIKQENKTLELETAKNLNTIENQLVLSDKAAKQQKREFEKETLTAAWQQALKAKELKSLLDDIGSKPVTRRNQIIEKQEGLLIQRNQNDSSFTYAKTDVEEDSRVVNPTPMSDNCDKVQVIKEKAKRIKEYLDVKEKESYQFKIRNAIKEAKKNRRKFFSLGDYRNRHVSPLVYGK